MANKHQTHAEWAENVEREMALVAEMARQVGLRYAAAFERLGAAARSITADLSKLRDRSGTDV